MAQNKNKKSNQTIKQIKSPTIKKNVPVKILPKKKKMRTMQKRGTTLLKWMLGNLVLLIFICCLMLYDTNVNGKGYFEHSAVGRVLKKNGLLPRVQNAWYTVMCAGARGYIWVEKHMPTYVSYFQPAADVTKDAYYLSRCVACNFVSSLVESVTDEIPAMAKFLEHHAPGLLCIIARWTKSAEELSLYASEEVTIFLKTKVFVGLFSPENLTTALNNTQILAEEYMNTLHAKITAYATLEQF